MIIFKKAYKFLAFMLMLSIITPSVIGNGAIAKAATTIKISKKNLTLEVGKTETIKIIGTKNKVTWSTSNKAVATVSSTGKITAKKSGKASITATVNKKKYTCKVTVKTPVNPFVKNAPFKAKETSIGNFKMVIPENWENEIIKNEGYYLASICPNNEGSMVRIFSDVSVYIEETDMDSPEYSQVKDIMMTDYTEEAILSRCDTEFWKAVGYDLSIANIKFSDYKSSLGTALKTEYIINYTSEEGDVYYSTSTNYDIFYKNYYIGIEGADYDEEITPDVNVVAEYLFKSMELKK